MKRNYMFALLITGSFTTAAPAQIVNFYQAPNILIQDINGKPMESKNLTGIIGTPMLSQAFGLGDVKFSNGKRADSVVMNVDLESNKLVYLHKGVLFEFVDPVQEFNINYLEDGKMKEALFRNGYPEAEKHKTTTLYRVLAEGPKFQLVQYNDKKTIEKKEYNAPSTVQYQLYTELFIYDPATRTMHRIKAKKSSVTSALPAMEQTIERLCNEHKLDLKTTDQVAFLVGVLQ